MDGDDAREKCRAQYPSVNNEQISDKILISMLVYIAQLFSDSLMLSNSEALLQSELLIKN